MTDADGQAAPGPAETDDAVPSIPLHDLLALEMDPYAVGPGGEVTMPVAAGAMGVHGNLHGGAIATMVDLACALAAVRTEVVDLQTQSMVTTDMHVRYFGQPRTDTVTAKAEVIRAGKQLIVVECKVSDGGGHVIASADVAMMLVARRRPAPAATESGEPG